MQPIRSIPRRGPSRIGARASLMNSGGPAGSGASRVAGTVTAQRKFISLAEVGSSAVSVLWARTNVFIGSLGMLLIPEWNDSDLRRCEPHRRVPKRFALVECSGQQAGESAVVRKANSLATCAKCAAGWTGNTTCGGKRSNWARVCEPGHRDPSFQPTHWQAAGRSVVAAPPAIFPAGQRA